MGWRPKAKPIPASTVRTFGEYYAQEVAGKRALAFTTQTSYDHECSYCGSAYPVEVRPTCSQCGAPRKAPASYHDRDGLLYGEGGFPLGVMDLGPCVSVNEHRALMGLPPVPPQNVTVRK